MSNITLRELIQGSGPLNEARALNYIKQIATQAGDLHKARSLHGMITPDAVNIDTESDHATLKLPDSIDEAKAAHYIPDDAGITSATDIYSVAALLYEMLTGEPPLPYAERVKGGTMRHLPSTVSASTAQAVERGLKLNPALRPKDVDVFTALTAPAPKPKVKIEAKPKPSEPAMTAPAEKAPTPKAKAPDTMPALPEPPAEPDKKEVMQRSLIIGGIAAAAILILGGGTFYCTRQSDDTAADTSQVILLDTILPFDTTRIDTTSLEVLNDTMMVEKMEIKNENGETFTYTGQVVKGLPEGKGHGEYKHGTYDGEYVAGVRQGKAKFITADKENMFEGTFKDDFYDEGKLLFTDSTYFKGSFKDGEPWNGNWYTADKKPFASYRNGKAVN